MKSKSAWLISIFGIILLICSTNACSYPTNKAEFPLPGDVSPELSSKEDAPTAAAGTTVPTGTAAAENLAEADVRVIKLPAPYDDARMEFSGMAWLGDKLVLLPQYHRRLGEDGSGFIVTIQKEDILAYLGGESMEPIETGLIAFDDSGLSESLEGFEGFEALAFLGEKVFLTIETSGSSPMMGYLVSGVVDEERQSIRLEAEGIVPLVPQTDFRNANDEALVVANEQLFTFFEDNGSAVNPNSYAHVFDTALSPQPQTDFPAIEYRVTDATEAQADGSFWVMNYFYPGDAHLKAEVDPIAQRFGEGLSHRRSDRVERILRLQLENGQIRMADEAPLYLSLTPDGSSRNWEGLVRLDELGFLAVTDSFPETILGFIPDLR